MMLSTKAARIEILRDSAYVQAMRLHGVCSPQVRAVLQSIIFKRQAVVLHSILQKKACS